ncbi:hypothetical protein [Streptomyces sp. Da 82-17]|uniref:hypothetical protein n=1 Tax=Streptomyces sp. Da 82-17 TaxID=3377116 RepID=UPI0038D3FDA3
MSIRNVYLDCEFLAADPSLRGLVSIGLTDDHGVDFYAVHQDFDVAALLDSEWMVDNVWPSLPTVHAPGALQALNLLHEDVLTADEIRTGVADYFADTDATETHLYAYYGGQDICRLHSLWDNNWAVMPDEIPRWFNELEMLRVQAGGPDMPEQESGLHNALEDARHNRRMHRFLREQQQEMAQLVRDLTIPEPCRLDEGCQEHFWFTDDRPCPHGRAHALFPDTKEQ